MDAYHQGRIVVGYVYDPQGRNPKARPIVVMNTAEEIARTGVIVWVAITTALTGADDEVLLPWQSEGRCGTKLKAKCAAKARWNGSLRVEQVDRLLGVVPPRQLAELHKKFLES